MLHIRSFATGLAAAALWAGPALASSFICQEPGGKRLIEIDGNDISRVGQPKALSIDGDDLRDRDGKKLFSLDDGAVRPGDTPVGVKLLSFDGDDLRHAAAGKVVMNYHHPDICPTSICPTSADNRIYTIEGDALSRPQLVAGLYLLKPELFKLTYAELAAQKNAANEANAEQEKLDNADPIAGKWTMLNGNGIAEKVDKGTIISLAFSPDGKFVAGDDGSLQSLDTASGTVTDFSNFRVVPYAIAPSPDNKMLYIATGGVGAKELAIATGKLANGFDCDGLVKAIALSPDGKTLVGGANDGMIYL